MIWKFLKQNFLFPKGLNWVQHWVSRIGLFRLLSRDYYPMALQNLRCHMTWSSKDPRSALLSGDLFFGKSTKVGWRWKRRAGFIYFYLYIFTGKMILTAEWGISKQNNKTKNISQQICPIFRFGTQTFFRGYEKNDNETERSLQIMVWKLKKQMVIGVGAD